MDERGDWAWPQGAMTRRECLACCAGFGAFAWATLTPFPAVAAAPKLHPASFYTRLRDGRTQCQLCPNRCERKPGEDGRCRARGNRGGAYYSLVYGRPCVIALDSVEKCPLYHFSLPGKTFSIATAGCNISCAYCQNWMFSQAGPDDVPKSYAMTPEDVVAKALENGAAAIAYFYTEPTVCYEYMLDIAGLARRHGLKNIMVTAGYINEEPLRRVLPYLDAVTLGLKGWNEEFYRDYIGGELGYVRRTIEILAETHAVWWEVVHLIVPSLNDSMEEIATMAAWLRDVAGPERPLHFTRFRPEYKLKRLPITPSATLAQARKIALEQGLKYVYVGNLPGHEGANTYCPKCKTMIVERLAFTVLDCKMNRGKCAVCGNVIEGVWS